ncbi:YiiX/YebB-like N1pC/P60 family cysteine hydrolase [Roseicitreum antarcticum]|uniref:Permuted papain-like amidase enzyme, YaeF/YiiX, C92 family n=1 Tax=Roseicitreum antarcticum TaxID=564137 RepID=A0A1H3FC76_9RHOB|nr:YiiX/YebB-like N1pC/P60 family cysteine hydrolase [Roseicitreum antarcticum]SDX87794.1 Permuted papain-like amidase enzyme, YaeF/YiiX, C92 family [Roseicitreum antarcticum]
MKRIKIDSVMQGDILFTARPGKTSKGIRFTTGGLVSHAMICVANGSFIDSTRNGVQARNLQRELFEDDEQAFHFRLKIPPERQILAQVIDYARAEIGARYSLTEAARSVSPFRSSSSKKQFCSRLVARVFNQAGIELVPNANYCTPEDLRQSPLLKELTVEFESVTIEELALMSGGLNPVDAMHDAQNAVLEAARSVDSKIESFNDLYALLVKRPETDQVIANALVSSGYLDLWKKEVARHPWRYTSGLMDKLSEPPKLLCDYCIGTIKEAYSGGVRFAINLIQC